MAPLRFRWLANLAVLLVLLLLGAGGPAAAMSRRDLPEKYRQWLEEVEPIITKPELETFLEIEKDYQRDAFIEHFWAARDPVEATARNEFKERYEGRLEEARSRFGNNLDERFRVFLLNGEPPSLFRTDCGMLLWPLEVWTYPYTESSGSMLVVIFYQPRHAGPYRIWRPGEGYGQLMGLGNGDSPDAATEHRVFYATLRKYCAELYDTIEELLGNFRRVEAEGPLGPVRAESPPHNPDPEWLQTFRAFSTDVPAAAAALDATVSYAFPGRNQSRTVVQGSIAVARTGATLSTAGEQESYGFLVTGEVLRDGSLFDSFRYRYDLPAVGDPAAPLLLLFERYLRPGAYTLVVKLEDAHGTAVFRDQREVEVPAVEAAGASQEEVAEAATEPAEVADGAPSITLSAAQEGMRAGYSRFMAQVSGAVKKVSFLLDDRPVMTKTRPPYSVELDLGNLPRPHTVRAVAYDAAGQEVATDQITMNPGEHAFVVRLVEPQKGKSYRGVVRAAVEVQAPEGELVDRVELFLNEQRVATLYQPPFVQPVQLADESPAFVRAVAYLADGNSTEDLVLINAGGYLEDVDVTLVELYASVVDRTGRPLLDLARDEVHVFEDGVEQRLTRFERLDNLPIYGALLIDTSASMAENLEEVRRVALGFFEQTIQSKDRAAVITFSEKPRLAVSFTNDLKLLGGGLAGLTAERSTALYDSAMFALYYFQGIKGQRALVILSDGEDRRSEATYDQVLDYARTAGVTIYCIGVDLGRGAARSRLAKLADETGGRAFFLQSIGELGAVTTTIQGDLRSRYLMAYQPPVKDRRSFRAIEVKVARPETEVRTQSGYYP